jgi:formamidopyrimidine-DNA glycosylase
MPEMPEVEIIRRGLSKNITGKRIMSVEVLLARLIKWPDAESFRALLTGAVIKKVGRRGKYLLLEMDNDCTLVVHLRMTGRLCYAAASGEKDAYARINFFLDDGAALVYGDTRTLGTLYVLKKDEAWRVSGLATLGPEPLSAEFTEEYLKGKLKKMRGKVKSFLLNQKYIGGLGNIYADESLFLAGILPTREGASLSGEEIAKLYKYINKVIDDGIKDGGTTFRDYRNSEGGKGSHQEKLFVYGRDREKCCRCGSIIEKTVVGGRGTHYCPVCQR